MGTFFAGLGFVFGTGIIYKVIVLFKKPSALINWLILPDYQIDLEINIENPTNKTLNIKSVEIVQGNHTYSADSSYKLINELFATYLPHQTLSNHSENLIFTFPSFPERSPLTNEPFSLTIHYGKNKKIVIENLHRKDFERQLDDLNMLVVPRPSKNN
ncbi:unnamed protein product [Fructobacillus fructosus]|uniref:Uncharacterized protein n=1 Tax=Fructobacillus fructosus TaxID=1631 RepID=A0ABM9N0S8_9LACO|nr:unnamed protein product [Fructobacillus fructosus]CAK1252891.1 unnamed protein product [Fructobacillus fructosus]